MRKEDNQTVETPAENTLNHEKHCHRKHEDAKLSFHSEGQTAPLHGSLDSNTKLPLQVTLTFWASVSSSV